MTHKVLTLWAGIKILPDGEEEFIGFMTDEGPIPMVSSSERMVKTFTEMLTAVTVQTGFHMELRRFELSETIQTFKGH